MIVYKEPTTGVNPVLGVVNVTTLDVKDYAVIDSTPVPVPSEDLNTGGAPGPVCDNGSNFTPLYTRGRSVPIDRSENKRCSLSSIVALFANDPGMMPDRTRLSSFGRLDTFSCHIRPSASRASVYVWLLVVVGVGDPFWM